MNNSCLDSPTSSPPSSPSSPLIGGSSSWRQEKHIHNGRHSPARDVPQTMDTCPGRALLSGGTVRHPLSADPAGSDRCAPLSELATLRHLLLSVAQAADALDCATVAPQSHSGRPEYHSVRQRATRKLHSLNDYLKRRGALVDDRWREEAEAGLHRLHRHMGQLPEPEPSAALCHDPSRASPAHHLFHLHLETRLLSVSVLARLSRLSARPPPADTPAGPNVPWLPALDGRHRWRRAAHALAWELAALAHSRMQQVPLSELSSTAAFSCGCEKGAWLALRRLLQSDGAGDRLRSDPGDPVPMETGAGGRCAGGGVEDSGGGLGLWSELDIMFGYILSETQRDRSDGPVEVFPLREVQWTEVPLFLTWLLCAVGDVFRYNKLDNYQADVTCSGNTAQLLSLLSAATDGDGGDSEPRLACLLALCGRLTALWGPAPPLANKLWEVVARRLVRPQPPGPLSVAQMTSVVPRSGRAWQEAVSHPQSAPDDSFGQYLRLLPAQLAGAAGADSWRQLRGRVLLRLHPRRATQLPAAGLTAACSLFLTLLHTITDDQQLLEKYVSFLSLVSESSVHQVLVCRAYFAAMHLLLESGRDVAGAAAPAAAQADRELRAAADGRPFSQPLLAAYWEECADLVRASPRLDNSEYHLITAAWRVYLGWCGPAELSRGLSVLLQLAGKLLGNIRQLQPMAHIVDTEVVTRTEQYGHLTERLRLLSPLLHSLALTASPPAELADLAVTLTLVPNSGCDLHHFTADTVTPTVCASYVTHLLSSAPDRLTGDGDRLVRLWLRCWAGAADRPELAPLTAAVARRQPLVPATSPTDRHTPAVFVDRLARLAEQGKEGQQRVNNIIGSLDYIDVYLRGARSGSAAPPHLYLVFGLIVKRLIGVLEHRKVVYIMNRLVLPPAVYDAEKPLAPPLRAALARCLPLFLAGIARTEYATHPFYRRCVKDTLVNYIYRFSDGSQPILDVLRSDDTPTDFKDFVVKMMADIFLQKSSGKFHPSLLQALQCLTALVSADRGDKHEVTVARQTAAPLLELLLSLEEPRAKRAATDLLKKLCQSAAEDVRTALSAAVERLLERHLAFSSARVFVLLEVVAVLAPRLTAALLPALEQHVRRTEVRRGVGEDRNLRNGLVRVQRHLAAAGAAVPPSAGPRAAS